MSASASQRPGLTSGYAAIVTTSNTATIPQTIRLYPKTAGAVYVDMAGNGDGIAYATVTGTVPAVDPVGDCIFTIGGTAITVTWTTSATATATALASAINANSTVNKLVVATSLNAVVTLTAVSPGLFGNAITSTGNANLTVSTATLTGGTGGEGNYLLYTAVAGQYLNIAVSRVYTLGTVATLVREW